MPNATTERKPRTPSATTLKVRAFATAERLRSKLADLQNAERVRREQYEERLAEIKAELAEADDEYSRLSGGGVQ